MRFPVLSSYPGSMIVCPSCRSPDGSCALTAVAPVSIVTIATKKMNPSFDGIVGSLLKYLSRSAAAVKPAKPREPGIAVQSSAQMRQPNFTGGPFLFRLFRAPGVALELLSIIRQQVAAPWL